MRRWVGSFTDFGDEFNLTESTETLEDIVVTDERIALDWKDDWDKYNAVLRPVQEDEFEIWRGDITNATSRLKCGEISGVRYNLKDGEVVLIVKWVQNGYEGNGMYEILKA